MSEIQIIEGVLQKTSARLRWERAWRGLWRGLLVGAFLWLAVLLAYKLLPIPAISLGIAGGLSLLAPVAWFLAGFCRAQSQMQTARWVDQQVKLQERLSTALEVSASPETGHWKQLIVNDAAKSVRAVDPRRLLPLQLPSSTRWVLLVLALGAGLGFVPEYRTKAHVQKQLEAEIIRDTGQRLAELTRRQLDRRPPALEPTRESLETVSDLGDHLAKAKLTRSDALKDLASVTEKLKDQAKELGNNPAFKPLDRAARESNKSGSPGLADLQKQIESLQKALGDQGADSKELENLKEQLRKAQEAASGLASKDANAAELQQQLEEALASLASQAGEMGVSLPSLEAAMAALAASKVDQLLKDLETTEIDLEKMLQMAKAMENLKAQAEALGKDLGEQLDKGQVEAAAATLQKMARQLQSGNPDSEQLKKILEEVSRAIQPAGEYGKVEDLLKQAAGQMKSGDKMAAAQSLQEAAKELDKLMQQFGDMQNLMASLDALMKAQMCIGNCQNWGMCQGPPRAGQGGKPGSGVGTWGDDSLFMDPNLFTGRWDNSGIERPDTDPRGVTDRGDGQVPDNLRPDKIRGQMNPGGPMPSITLKGVSVKGMSKVQFEEMATAAQSEAQSALSQQQVPRAYQNAVRDYFDDLKP